MINFKFISLLATLIGMINIFIFAWFISYFTTNKKRMKEREQRELEQLESFYKTIRQLIEDEHNTFDETLNNTLKKKQKQVNKINKISKQEEELLNKIDELNQKIISCNNLNRNTEKELTKYKNMNDNKKKKIKRLIEKLKILNPDDEDVKKYEKQQQKQKEKSEEKGKNDEK